MFEVFFKPGEDGVLPLDALVVVEDVMVLIGYGYEGGGASEQLQCCKHLYALAVGHIIVAVAMEEEEGSCDLVGKEERALAYI